MLTDDDALADALRSLRVHGQGSDKYDNVRIGLASRLDTIQAAVLSEKLKIFPDEIEARNRIARRYARGLADVVTVPTVPEGYLSVWAQYTIRIAGGRRDAFAAALKAEGIPTAIYYPIPLHRQVAYKHYPVGQGGAGGERPTRGRGDQPADARLSRRGDAGPHHRRDAAGVEAVAVIPGREQRERTRNPAAPSESLKRTRHQPRRPTP